VSGQLELLLCQVHQKSYCHLVGNATAGIYLAIVALGLRGKQVAIPNSVCPNVPLAVLLSGNTPLYLDISRENLGIDIHALKSMDDSVDAVIAVHAYGSICDLSEISTFCKSRNIPLIEDIAVAQGAKIEGRPVGGFSDIAVVSFGSGKIIDVGHGGAILTDNLMILGEVVAHEVVFSDCQPSDKDAIDAFGHYHTKLYNEHYGPNINAFSSLFKKRALELGKHILYKFDYAYQPIIKERLEMLDSLVDLRRNKAETLERLLASYEPNIRLFYPPAGSVHWRFNLFINNRDNLLKLLLAKNFKVSSWFPSADLFFEDRTLSGINTAVSDSVGDQILNLWVNEEVDIDYIKAISSEIIAYTTHAAH
jgi:dTDP-4-amino-4,6-dideoxygalactose transaminase